MAEAVIRHRLDQAGLGEHIVVESAGTGGWHAGEPADERAVGVLNEHGYDGSAHRARQIKSEDFDQVDLVLALDRDNLADLHRLAPDDAARAKIQMLRSYDPEALDVGELDVPDPFFGGPAEFEQVLRLVEQAADGLVSTIRAELSADTGGEIGQP
ncbi:MAG: low molecular weight protein-tyrosine-phosphatase [Jiangellaceae bacterium]